MQNRGEGLPSMTCWHFSWFSPEGSWLSLLWGHSVGSFSAWCPLGSQGPCLQSCFSPRRCQPVQVYGVILPQEEDLALPFLELSEIPIKPVLQSVRVSQFRIIFYSSEKPMLFSYVWYYMISAFYLGITARWRFSVGIKYQFICQHTNIYIHAL